jgi:bifunctional non-homologous end joining protein LigD
LGFIHSGETMNTLAKTSLYYCEGTSDKEYHAEIVEVPGGNVVNFRYGRRGGALTVGTKTASPVDSTEAQKIYDKLVKEKTSKGYTADTSGVAYQGTELAGRKSDFVPQLLNPITESEAMKLIADNDWAAQEKIDGERRAAYATEADVVGINRKGLFVPLPQPIADELLTIAASSNAIHIDGEIIGDILYVFDLHMHQGISLHSGPWSKRMRLAQIALAQCEHIKTVPVAITTAEKRRLWSQVKAAHGEGIVFKRLNSPVTEGRPNSGGDWLKFKFTETATVQVGSISSSKRSVRIDLFDEQGDVVHVGNVTIPQNYEIPKLNTLVDVEYLYAYKGGCIYQPVYRGIRTDLDITACTLSQLKYKPEGNEPE